MIVSAKVFTSHIPCKVKSPLQPKWVRRLFQNQQKTLSFATSRHFFLPFTCLLWFIF